ncbi:MAG: DUF6966 domain-containing protein [Marmoricola sp.]
MDRSEAEPRYMRLLANLVEIQPLLRSADLAFWADWMATCEVEVRTGDGRGLERVKRAYGGMGSINDIFFENLPHGELIENLKEAIWVDADALLSGFNRTT